MFAKHRGDAWCISRRSERRDVAAGRTSQILRSQGNSHVRKFAWLLCMSLVVAHAQALQGIEVTEYGIYATDTANSSAAPGTATGKIDQVSNIKLVQSTTTVPARLGVEFGFRYKIIGQGAAPQPPQAGDDFWYAIWDAATCAATKRDGESKYVTHIPKPGMRNPETGNVTLTNVFYQDHKLGEELYRLYRLTERWEIVPGVWTLEIWEGDRKMLSQDFLVKK